jgi:hypothetical protein
MTRHTLESILLALLTLALTYLFLWSTGYPGIVWGAEYTATGTNVTAGINDNGTAWVEDGPVRCDFTFEPGVLVVAKCSNGTGWSYDGNEYFYMRPIPGYILPPGINGVDITDSVSITYEPL